MPTNNTDLHPIRILLAERHPLTRQGIRTRLMQTSDLSLVGEAQDGSEALRFVDTLMPNVLVLDLHLPMRSGIEVAHQLRASHPWVEILVFTNRVTRELIRHLPASQVAGYLSKEEPIECLLTALRGIARRERGWYSASVQQYLHHLEAETNEARQALTLPQIKILRLLAQGKANTEISHTLHFSEKAVEKQLTKIYRNLGVSGRVGAALFALDQGIDSL